MKKERKNQILETLVILAQDGFVLNENSINEVIKNNEEVYPNHVENFDKYYSEVHEVFTKNQKKIEKIFNNQ